MGAWSKSGFVAASANADPTAIAELGLFSQLVVQAAVGLGTIAGDYGRPWIERCDTVGLAVAAWAWCDGTDVAGEARAHARVLEELRLRRFVANIEEAYDAHGNSSSPRYRMPTLYLTELQAELNRLAWTLDAIAVTTTPRFGSDMTEWVTAGATVMPQAFPLENKATVLETVEHARAWGWPTDRIRPLVQTYKTNGTYPDAAAFFDQARQCRVAVIPYLVETALDTAGRELLTALGPALSPSPPLLPALAPRALYPPDVPAPYFPSRRGPDVVDVKQALSRLGYWTNGPYDDRYSNAIAHGTPAFGGVAGFQRSVGIRASGWYGTATHQALHARLSAAGWGWPGR